MMAWNSSLLQAKLSCIPAALRHATHAFKTHRAPASTPTAALRPAFLRTAGAPSSAGAAHRRFSQQRSLVASASSADVAESGDQVSIHYVGTLDDGTEFDSSRSRGEPLSFQLGAGRVVPGFEKLATGMAVGDRRKSRLAPEDAYGPRRDGMMAKVQLSNAPEGLTVGVTVQLQNGMSAVVTEVDDEFVTIDANHPLAGQALTFDVELMSLAKAANLKTGTFGAGCFWSVELAFARVPGVISTEVGYCNGHVENVTYEQVCNGDTGHNEVVQLRYNEGEVSYDQLLDAFFAKHDPTTLNRQGNDVGEQYRSGIYYHSEEQKAAAEAYIERLNKKMGGQVVTEVEPIKNYCKAEEYHQQYLEKGGRSNRPQSAAKGCTDPIRCYG